MSIPRITPQDLAMLLEHEGQRPVLVDVRTVEEHALVSLPDSRLLPLAELQERDEEISQLAGHQVVVYCHHGVRSLNGAAYLREHGIDAASLEGGIDRYARQVDPTLPRY